LAKARLEPEIEIEIEFNQLEEKIQSQV